MMTPLKLSFLCCLILTGCTVGPDYVRPELASSTQYNPDGLSSAAGSGAPASPERQRFDVQRDIEADWWTVFRSPKLNALIEQAFISSPTIEVARRSLNAAQQNIYAQQGFFFPTVQAGFSPSRTRLPGNLSNNSPGIQGDGSVISGYQGTPADQGGSAPFNGPVTYNFHTANLTVGFAPDIFGANRRAVESAQSLANAQKYQLQAAYVTLATNIVAAAVQDALFRKQISILNEMVTDNETSVSLARRQFAAGYVSQLDLSMQETALAQTRQLLPPLRKQFEQNRDLLRLLVGQPQDYRVPDFTLEEFTLPDALPLSLPSRLVEQRPDVKIAEEQLRAANAQIGIARAARLPQVLLNGSIGGTASNFNQMFWSGSGLFFDLILGLTQPIFDGGTLKRREYAASETMKQAAAQYRSTVLIAFQNVADTLHAIDADASALKIADEQAKHSKKTYDLTQRQHKSGYLDRLALITAQQNYRQALMIQVQMQSARLGNTAALFQALGGGWWNRATEDLDEPQ